MMYLPDRDITYLTHTFYYVILFFLFTIKLLEVWCSKMLHFEKCFDIIFFAHHFIWTISPISKMVVMHAARNYEHNAFLYFVVHFPFGYRQLYQNIRDT